MRALLIDVHYGFPGASRIKTDLSGDRPTREILEEALGTEGLEAAMRIRARLVGADEGSRGLYLCHGFCEIGAYELVPTLREIRSFLLQHPGEVLLMVVEDYVTPEDLARAFADSNLEDFVYRGPAGPPWPELYELVASGQNLAGLPRVGPSRRIRGYDRPSNTFRRRPTPSMHPRISPAARIAAAPRGRSSRSTTGSRRRPRPGPRTPSW